MKRFALVLVAVMAIVSCPASAQPPFVTPHQLQLVEATVPDLQLALRSHLITSEQLVQMYLNRIAAYDNAGPMLNSFIHINEDALDEARARALDRHRGLAPGPLFGCGRDLAVTVRRLVRQDRSRQRPPKEERPWGADPSG